MILILGGAVAVTATVAWYRITLLSSIDPGDVLEGANAALHDSGMNGLKAWLTTVVGAHPDLDIYVVDTNGDDILQRPLPEHVVHGEFIVRQHGEGLAPVTDLCTCNPAPRSGLICSGQ